MIAIDEAGSSRYEDLHDWLVAEPDLHSLVKRKLLLPEEGELGGGALDFLTVAVGSGGALSVLAGALSAWLTQARNRRVQIRIERRDGPLKAVSVHARNTRVADIERLLRTLNDEDQQCDGHP